MQLQSVPKVLLLARMAALLVAFFLITAGFAGLGLILALLVLIAGLALRNIKVKAWVIEKLTGLPREAIHEVDRRRKAGERVDAPIVVNTDKPKPLPREKLDALLEQNKQTGIALRRVWPLDAPADQNSWLGGLPRLPEGVAWPENPETGMALHHMAQIDLSEMPRVPEGPQLPKRGTLFFFADINENMCWAQEPGMPEARVLYVEDDTRDLPLREVPENLPEIDHRETKMDSALWGFRPPVRRVHGRWPVTGHLIDTWDEDSLPEGLDWTSGYSEAVEARTKAERARVLGPAPERPKGLSLLKRGWIEPEEEGGKGTSVISYTPESIGEGFPFNNAVAVEVLRDAIHVARADKAYAERTADIDAKAGREKSARHLEQIEVAGRLLPEAEALVARLAARDPAAAITPADKAAFDSFVTTYGTTTPGYNWLRSPTRALMRVVARGAYDRALLRELPQEALERVAHVAHPGHDNARHYLLGAKGIGANPTAGQGVRLLQLDSDGAVEFMFCDVGIVDFWIDEDDLAAGRWERAWAATAGG